MKLLLHGMTQLRDQEAFLAEQIHGKTFPTFAEGYTALAEELQETHDELRRVEFNFAALLRTMREPNSRTHEQAQALLEDVEHRALLAACELVQTAYVAGKMIRSMDRWTEQGGRAHD